MNDIKVFIIGTVWGFLTLLTPIKDFMISMIVLFSVNFLFGLVAARFENEDWSWRKAAMFFVSCCIFFVTVAALFVAGHYLHSDEQAVFSTRDAELQKAIEGHHWYDDKFWILEAVDEKKLAAESKKKEARKAEDEKKTHYVEDFQEAKEYLADTFGVSRSKMKTQTDILAVAKECGVELEGLSK